MSEHLSDAQLVTHMAGELNELVRERVEQHLLVCKACQMQLDQFRQTENLLRAQSRVVLPAQFAARVRARATIDRSHRFRQFAVAACALLLLGAVGGWTAQNVVHPSPQAMVRSSTGNRFMILFVENSRAKSAASADVRRRAALDFGAWFGAFPPEVILGGAHLVANDTYAYGTVQPLPAATDSLQLTGFIVVQANSHADVATYAERCPIIAQGGQVIVRQIY